MNINNPTLAHFRHFSPLFTNFPTTNVEKPLQIRPFLCKTNPIFRIFRLKSMISLKNKPNSNPIQTQTKPILSQNGLYQSQTKPKQTQYVFCPLSSVSCILFFLVYSFLLCIICPKMRVLNKINRCIENWRFRLLQGRRSRQCPALSMEPDADQIRNKPFECRVILLGALSSTFALL
jgi:hypothetical protein